MGQALCKALRNERAAVAVLWLLTCNKQTPSYKQVAPVGLLGHLGQVFDVNVNKARLVALEGLIGLRRILGFWR